ncbi:MAG: transcription termination/antitermination protein NusA [SAR202 cluster bacterium]|nr:transcription termination/antitermination protein NusA [SAR202 cluster bacterium]
MKSDFLIALTQLAAERHLPREQVLQAIEAALASAFKKDNPASGQNISVKLNPNTGDVNVYALKTVVELVQDPAREISLKDAKAIKSTAALGEEVAAAEPLPHNASRIAAQTAKQVVLQRLREAERELLYKEFLQRQDDVMSGVVEQIESGRTIVLDMGRAQAILPPEEQVPTERYKKGQRVKVYVLSVRSGAKGPEVLVSRSHKNLLKRLFEIEVPEVHNGVVEIKAIAREGGFRSKVAVRSTQEGIDPVGSCIGVRGNRIQSIVNELQGEKIDVVLWDKDPRTFISKALSPSEVVHVDLSPADQNATVVVPDRQLSLAIGKEGQNARLAARLTGWRLDIKGMTEWEEIKVARQKKREEEVRLAAQAAAAAALAVPAVAEAPAAPVLVAVAEAAAPAAVEPVQAVPQPVAAAPEPVPVAAAAPAPAAKPAVAADEEALLEALIHEEEAKTSKAGVQEPAPAQGLSVEALANITLEELEVEEEEEEAEAPKAPLLTPDAGKIRFAEDIIEDYRGGGGRSGQRRPRRGGPPAGGANRGGGARRGGGGR